MKTLVGFFHGLLEEMIIILLKGSLHKIIEWPGLKRTTIINWFQSPAMCRVTNHQPRLPRATSSLALNASRSGASTTSLGNLFQCVTTLCVKNFFLISNLNLPCLSLKSLCNMQNHYPICKILYFSVGLNANHKRIHRG